MNQRHANSFLNTRQIVQSPPQSELTEPKPNSTVYMNTLRPLSLRPVQILSGLLMAAFGAPLIPAQTEEPVIEMSVFEISETQPNRYQAAESTSGGRIRTDIFDSSQTVNVVTNELMEDVGAIRLVDALKYVPGVTQSVISTAADYTTIRGFQFVGRTVDGFGSFTQSNADPITIERVEVIKGPNAILSPSGTPGGTVNSVSKKPQFTSTSSITVEAGLFEAGAVTFDSTGPLAGMEDKLAYRIVGAVRDYDYYYDQTGTRSFIVDPSVTYRLSDRTQITVQAEFAKWRGTNYLGIPLDPASGSTNRARLIDGVPDDIALYYKDVNREESRQEYRVFLTSEITDHLSTRIAARHYIADLRYAQLTFSGNSGGARDPLTGLWTPGFVYGPGPDYTPSPAPAQSRIFNQGGVLEYNNFINQNFQNDWVYQRDFDQFSSTTAAGFAYARGQPDSDFPPRTRYAITNSPFDIDNVTLQQYGIGAINRNYADQSLTRQYYINEVLTVMDERLILSGGVSTLNFSNRSDNYLNNSTVTVDSTTETYNYGVVVKPIDELSLYYGHSENASPNANSNSAPGTPDFSEGVQDEIGVRVRLADGKINFGAVYFEISQTAFAVANPGNLTVPAPNPPLPNLYQDREAKGWEFESTFEIGSGFTLIGNYADFTNRSPLDVPFRGTAERSAAAWLRYDFSEGNLRGLNISIGTNYLDRIPGDGASGITAASTSTNVIPNQPSFWLPARTLVDLAIGYSTESWMLQANVDNVLNKDYIAASVNRFLVYPGTPTNLRVSATYKF